MLEGNLTHFARELRQKPTEAESLLWRHLRNRHCAGFKFRRQYVIDNFIVDFYCPAARLAIEVDGGGHAESKQELYDEYRTGVLQEYGVRVLRFWNDEVLRQIDAVMDEIHQAVTSVERGRRAEWTMGR